MTMRRFNNGLLVSFCLLWAAPVFAHGGSAIEEDTCVRSVSSGRIHFNAYQPDLDRTGHYCDKIPATGATIIVIDLVDKAMRAIPTSLRISTLEDRETGEVLVDLMPDHYVTGVIEAYANFPAAGRYLAEITFESQTEEKARFVIVVGAQGVSYAALAQLAVVGLILAWLLVRLYRRWRPEPVRSGV